MQGWQLPAKDHGQHYQGSLLQPHIAILLLHCLSVAASYMPSLTPKQYEKRLNRGLKWAHSSAFYLSLYFELVSRLHDRFWERLLSSETADRLISELVQLMSKRFFVRTLLFTKVEVPGLEDASSTNFNLSAHNSMKGMIGFISQLFPQQMLYCSGEGKGKSKDSFRDQTMVRELRQFSCRIALWFIWFGRFRVGATPNSERSSGIAGNLPFVSWQWENADSCSHNIKRWCRPFTRAPPVALIISTSFGLHKDKTDTSRLN